MADNVVISEARAREWAKEILGKVGVSGEYAEYVSDCLVNANLRGVDTHGLVRLVAYAGRMQNTTVSDVQIVNEGQTTCVIDAGFQLGPVGATIGMKKAIEKARDLGTGMAVVRNSNHCGTAAYYALMAAEQGMLGISMTNASRRIAPWGSVEAIIGNNPWSIALPGGEFPVVLDMANTVVANGKIRTCMREGKPLPDGWAMDKNGNPTNDPAAAQDGLLMPIGGYKGVGIATMVDILCSVLSGGVFSKEVGRIDDIYNPTKASHFFLAVDIKRLLPLDEEKARMAEYVQMFKNVKLKEGIKEVFLPGEIEWRVEQTRRREGISLSVKTIAELNALADSVNASHIDT